MTLLATADDLNAPPLGQGDPLTLSWWHEAFGVETDPTLPVLSLRLGAAFVLGCVVALIHRLTGRRGPGETPSLGVTLVLLSILIAMVTQVVGNNQARAFSLVGALAIIRFRTVVEDTRDTAFVIFAVVVGMACGAGHLPVALVGMGIVGVAAFLLRHRPSVRVEGGEFILLVRIGLKQGMDGSLERLLETHADRVTLTGTSTARQGAALEMTWLLRLKSGVRPQTLVGELNHIEGVQTVELKQR